MLNIILTVIFSFILSASAFDRYNTYQWNRANRDALNLKVDRSPWFEWWYYKVVIPETGKSYFFVYGVINPWDKDKTLKGTKSYVTMGDFSQKLILENSFLVEDFKASDQETYVQIQNNIATDKNIVGELKTLTGKKIKWNIQLEKKWAFNAQGWLLGSGVTDIEWYPAQASALCSGEVIDGMKKVKFSNAPCYQDRNWGSRFPKWWTWIVSNSFSNSPETALAVGGGKPTVSGRVSPLAGIYIGLKHQAVEYSFRPTDLNLVKSEINFGKWKISAMNKTHLIRIEASAPVDSFMDLQFMSPHGEIFHDYETLNGKLEIKLYRRIGPKFQFVETLNSNHTGIEFGSSSAQVKEN